MFTPQDLEQIISHGLDENGIRQQLKTFENGAPFTQIVRAASIGNGVEFYDLVAQKELAGYYDEKKRSKRYCKVCAC